ncbi:MULTISPECIES: hypothetical protein [Streptomycetaceae]|uniref:hypothetical protein n=1 Tax=Streptomycetaceae TaxID=2062 RepID=UPI0005A93A24|nr:MULTISPECIES: hypothetical protein [Streptomycetaceae]MYS59531.1 hypothetical protein [Streptomyces sp. SID5468]
MDTTATTEHELTAADLPPLLLALPAGFHPLPLGTEGAEREAAVSALVREIFPRGNETLWAGFAGVYSDTVEMMLDAELSFAAVGFFDVGDGNVGQCSLTVAATVSGHASPETAADGICEILSRTSEAEVQRLDLPCGPAVLAVSGREITVDARATTTGEDTVVRTRQLQVMVPFPTGPYLAVFTMETPAMQHWEDFSTMMSEIMRSVAFPEQDAENADG